MNNLLNIEFWIDPHYVMFIPTVCMLDCDDDGKRHIGVTWLGVWLDFSLGDFKDE